MPVIMIQPSEARELCSDSEWKLVESSFPPTVETLPRADLKSRIARISKLQLKSTDLVHRQHSDSRQRTTRRKAQLFGEAVGRFEVSLKNMPGAEPEVLDLDTARVAKENREIRTMLRERADQEFESRKSETLSALAARGEQQGGKSGERRIQSHIGSATRRQQGRRDSKNR